MHYVIKNFSNIFKTEKKIKKLKKRINSIKVDSRLVLSYLRDSSCLPVPRITVGTHSLYNIFCKTSRVGD